MPAVALGWEAYHPTSASEEIMMRALVTAVSVVLLYVSAAWAQEYEYLLVASWYTNSVLRYDAHTGAFIDVFASGGGLSHPEGLALGPRRTLLVSSWLLLLGPFGLAWSAVIV